MADLYTLIAVFLSVAAIASYINYRLFKLPNTIGLMIIGLGMSLIILGLNAVGLEIRSFAESFLQKMDFGQTLMQGMLSFLLFAGALKINLNDLLSEKTVVIVLATGGVIVSTLIVGTALFFTLDLLNINLSYIYCLVFGALIAPTDPVAVLALLKSTQTPRYLSIRIAGESLFNDGVGVVVFTVLLGIAVQEHSVTALHVVELFGREALGGVAFGLLIGYAAYLLLKDVDDYTVEALITLALVAGGYSLAAKLHTSGPIAIVVAGLLIGNYGRALAMSEITRDRLDKFWELIDEILNAVLFVWIGLEVLVISFNFGYLIAGLIAIPIALLARFISVWGAMNILQFRKQFTKSGILILTWGGLRGGISIAMALSLKVGYPRGLIVMITYVVVLFAIIVQGLTIRKLIRPAPVEG